MVSGQIPPDIYPLENNPPYEIPPGHIPTIQKYMIVRSRQ